MIEEKNTEIKNTLLSLKKKNLIHSLLEDYQIIKAFDILVNIKIISV